MLESRNALADFDRQNSRWTTTPVFGSSARPGTFVAVDLDASRIIESYLSLRRFTYDEFRKVKHPMEVSWENPRNPVWSPDGKPSPTAPRSPRSAKSSSGT
jgi:hypothetical protein